MGAVAALFFTNHSVELSSDSAIGQLAVITCMKEKRGILPRFQNESVLVPKFVEAPKRCLRGTGSNLTKAYLFFSHSTFCKIFDYS